MQLFCIGIKAIIVNDNKILFLKRLKDDSYYWDVPGGRMDEGEEIEETLGRELREEIGLKVKPTMGELLGVYKSPRVVEHSNSLLLVFYFVSTPVQEVILSHEHVEFIWIEKNEVENFFIKENEFVSNGVKMAVRKMLSLT